MSVASQITTPTVVTTGNGRNGICIYDNPNQTNNYLASAYVIFPDGTWAQLSRASLTAVVGASTGESAFSYAGLDGVGP